MRVPQGWEWWWWFPKASELEGGGEGESWWKGKTSIGRVVIGKGSKGIPRAGGYCSSVRMHRKRTEVGRRHYY